MRRLPDLALGAVVALIYGYMLMPLAIVALFSVSERSFFSFPPRGFSLEWYRRAAESDRFLQPALLSIGLAIASTALAAAIAIPATLALRRYRRTTWARAVEFLLLTPLVVPALILGIALLYFFTRLGAIDTVAGMLAAHTALVFPFVFRAVLTNVLDLRREHEEASEILGASPLTTFRRVTLPSLTPGIAAGAVFAFIVSFDQFTVSLFVGPSELTTLPVAIYRYLYDVNDPVVAAVSTMLVGFGLVATICIQRAGWLKHLGGGSA